VVLGTLERLRRVACDRYSCLGLDICVEIVLLFGLFDIGILMTGNNDGLSVLLTLLIVR